ncbi:SulP family inorganic anion transporter [Pedobacter glucosidilyticus]|uniref:SulP family inorganic anion transporter n=1 Tax=Pedobacter glucosidilyticus TaxID=1122941 RepID=UPI0004166113|nr:SulP family inorganic anion transporter [Pedobacter glucosidilyticus]
MEKDHKSLFPGFNAVKYFNPQTLKKDLPSSIVVFLVALPLCLGIALASGAPLFAGLLTGIIGGIVVASFSGSQLSVSGPAAGLTVIVLNAITQLGSYDVFILAVLIAGIIQIILGIAKAGTIGNYFPSAVIEGMLAAIGIILILKQLPHALGYDKSYEGEESFKQVNDDNTFTAIITAVENMQLGAVIIAVLSLAILILWPKIKQVAAVPAALVVVLTGIGLTMAFQGTGLALTNEHMVQIPMVASFTEFQNLFLFPDFSAITNPKVWTVAVTIAIVASLETLLSLEAIDKIDPQKRVSPTNRELVAQGVGNTVSGLLGGLPMTSVIVRSSANVNSGARTKMSAVFHGLWLLTALLVIPGLINQIPLAALAAILLFTGYKLANATLFSKMWRHGKNQFIPFIVTVLAVVFTDLLTGVAVGMLIGVFYLLRANMRNPYFYKLEKDGKQKTLRLKLSEEVSFLNKGAILYTLTHIPKGAKVVIDGTNSKYIDRDVLEIIENFHEHAYAKQIDVELVNIHPKYELPKLQDLIIQADDIAEIVDTHQIAKEKELQKNN